MADGSTKAIEDVAVGDMVLSDDPEDCAPPQAQKVEAIYRTATYRLFHIEVGGPGGGEVLATGVHPFWTQRGWVAAEDLETTDLLMDNAGVGVAMRGIAVESRDTPTFNLSVAQFHTYFVVVGPETLLVHNEPKKPHHPMSFEVRTPQGNVRVVGNAASAPMSTEEKVLPYPANTNATHTEARTIRTVEVRPGETLNMHGVEPPCTNCRGQMNKMTKAVPGATAEYDYFNDEGELVTWRSQGGKRCP
jgi:hypothetical protein